MKPLRWRSASLAPERIVLVAGSIDASAGAPLELD